MKIPSADACVAGDQDAGDCESSIQDYGETCVCERNVPKRTLRWSALLIGLAALGRDKGWLLTVYAVSGKGGCDRMHGCEESIRAYRDENTK